MAADLIQAALLYRREPERNFPVPQGDATIGYDAANEVRVPFEGVSRRHARITYDGKDYFIEDAGSANGTFLNGNRLLRKERLRHLDVITLGRRTDLIFVRKTMEASRVKRRGIEAAYIETVDGPETGRRDEIPKGSITIGRAPSNNIVADSQLISKIHARLERSGVQLVLIDLQSANGTYVEGKRVTSQVLKDGEVFNLGHGRSYRVRLNEGEVFTHDVAMAPGRDATVAELPIDWKTRIEWTPEEKAVFDKAAAARKSRTFAQLPAQPTRVAPPPKSVPAKPPAGKPVAKPAPEPKRGEPPAASKPVEPSGAPKPAAPPAVPKPAPPAAAPKPAEPPPASKPAAPPVAEKPVPPPPSRPPAVKPPEPPLARPSLQPPAPIAPTQTERKAPDAVSPTPPPPVRPVASAPGPEAKPPVSIEALPPPPPPPAAAAQAIKTEPLPSASSVKPPGPEPPPPARPQPPSPPSPSGAVPVDEQLTRPLEAKPAGIRGVILEGADMRFTLPPGDHEIGRMPGMSVQIEASGISRHHAMLRVTELDATVQDLGSKNGTYVNSQRIVGARRLITGDRISIGEIKLIVRLEPR